MSKQTILILFTLLVSVFLSHTVSKTIVLQNGTGNYSGCRDAALWNIFPDDNVGEEGEVMTFNCTT